jgi:hypothetical protein
MNYKNWPDWIKGIVLCFIISFYIILVNLIIYKPRAYPSLLLLLVVIINSIILGLAIFNKKSFWKKALRVWFFIMLINTIFLLSYSYYVRYMSDFILENLVVALLIFMFLFYGIEKWHYWFKSGGILSLNFFGLFFLLEPFHSAFGRGDILYPLSDIINHSLFTSDFSYHYFTLNLLILSLIYFIIGFILDSVYTKITSKENVKEMKKR